MTHARMVGGRPPAVKSSCPRWAKRWLRGAARGNTFAMRTVSLLCLLATAGAVEDLAVAFDPRPTPPELAWRSSGEARWYAAADDRDGSGALGFDREAASLSWLGLRGEHDEGWLTLRGERNAVDGTALLPSGASPAGDYLDLAAGARWKHLLGGGDVIGATASATLDGQASVVDGLEWGGTGTVFGRLGLGPEGRDGLLLALNYDVDRVIFGTIPVLPLVAWQGQRGPWMLLLGAPFSLVTYRAEAWRVDAMLGPLPALSAEHRIHGPWRVFGDARWTRKQWRRAGRAQHDDRLELSQWEWSGGLRLGFGPMAQFDLCAGAATARRLGEDEDGQHARRDGLALEAAPFAAFRGRISL